MKVKSIYLLIILLFAMWTTGCSNGAEGEENFPPSIPGYVGIDGEEYEMKRGGYRWERKKGLGTEVVMTDAASPYQIAGNFKTIPVSKNVPIKIQIKDNPEIKVFLWDESGRIGEIDMEGNEFNAPENNGEFIYEVVAEWPNGEISYTFVIGVK